MKQAQYSEYGNPETVVNIIEKPSQVLQTGQVKLELEVANINPADLFVISGSYPLRPNLPATPGNEGVARVKEVYPGIKNVKVGDRVFIPFRSGLGAWSEEIIVTNSNLIVVPDNADPEQLAMAAVNPPTAYYMLTKYVQLQPGDWIIQNLANSAVGRYVICFAKKMGVKTINLVRRESAIEELKKFGGDIVLVDEPDIAKKIKILVEPSKIKLAFDGVAGDATHRLGQCITFGGTIVNYGAMSMGKCELGASGTIFKQLTLKGVWLQKWTEMAPKEEVEALYKVTNKAVIQGEVKTTVEAVYPLSDIKKAIQHAAKENRNGKVLVSGPAYKKK